MKKKNITSLRKYRAQRCFDNYVSLHPSQRTQARSSLLLEVMFEYAYESVPRHKIMSAGQISVDADESRQICARLEEFIPRVVSTEGEPIMTWLHDNLVPEAWTYPEDMRNLVRDFLRAS